MPLAFVLINTEMGAKVEAESMTKLKEVVTWNIRRLDTVKSTLSMIVMSE
jgi:hypothetical protein